MSEIAAGGAGPAWRNALGAGSRADRGVPDTRRVLQLTLAGIFVLHVVAGTGFEPATSGL